MTLCLDSSAAYSLIAERTSDGAWLRAFAGRHDFVAPSLFGYELLNLLRRNLVRGELTEGAAASALEVADSMPVTTLDFDAIRARAWELRSNFTFFDAAYVAVAEGAKVPLVTLDRRLARAPGARCEVVTPPG